MQGLVERSSLESWSAESGRSDRIRNAVKRVFGCWHRKLSLPFTRGHETYQTCISCGARRRYDMEKWTAVGDFYYPERMR